MPRKLVGYFLLSFLSFCFFSAVFHTIANAQTAQPALQQPEIADTAVSLPPTPTMYNASPTISQQPIKTQNSILSPTPTVYMAQVPTTNTQIPVAQDTKIPPTATPTSLPTATPTPTIIPTATPTPQPTIATTADLETLFGKYSAVYSVAENELKKIASCESGFNTTSDTGLYAGMFQFSAGTWGSTRGMMGLDPNPDLRKNPEEAIKTAAFMLSRGEENAWPNCH